MTVFSAAVAFLSGGASAAAAGRASSMAFAKALSARGMTNIPTPSERSVPQQRCYTAWSHHDPLPLTSSLAAPSAATPRGACRPLSSSAVEEDLDAALDDILSGAIKEASDGDVDDGEFHDHADHMKGSHPMPDVLVEKEDPINYKDPKFTSTSNSYWVDNGMSQKIIDALSEKGITNFTPVQAEAFKPVLAGRDVIGRSRTGTGKTLAFGIPSVSRIIQLAEEKGTVDDRGRRMRGRLVSMLVLCPTRELARQVQEEINIIARPFGLNTAVFHGGVSYDPQARALRNGLDICVGTPGRTIDHIENGNLDLSECDVVVLDEADEMLNMGFAEDVERALEGIGSTNEEREGRKTQCLLFSATTPPWVKQIGRKYQEDVLTIDSTTEQGGARVATTVRHVALQVPPGPDSKRAILEDIIAIEISKDAVATEEEETKIEEGEEDEAVINPIAAKALAEKKKTSSHMQQKIFGKTIVFTETKREADELVSGGVFKSLTAQALHGDVGQKQRDATLAAFRSGSFNVLVATDVAARGIDIRDVDLVVQIQPPRDPDTYVHRSGRTGRAGRKGTSVILFDRRDSRNIVSIERSLGHGFKFDLQGPPSVEAALHAVAKTSALASQAIPEETSQFFRDSAAELLESTDDPVDTVARCLAAISRRSADVQSRSLLTGEAGFATIEMSNSRGRPVSPADVMFTVSKLARMSRRDGESDSEFDNDVGKIQSNIETGSAMFDMSVEDAKNLVEFSKDIDAGGATFKILREMGIERDYNFAVEEAAVAAVGVAVVVVVVVVVGAEGEDGVATEETSAVVDAVEGDGGEVMAIGVVAVAEATAGLGTIIMVDLMRTGAVVVAVAVVVGDMKEG
eukprot:CAMPEP_0113580260 /NCGR_PEP_ID=MMETSP0015_2-20120614/30570_1 /TAXON_ID=2838 /ORGANISM="Odontella" /LENGTH=857 /DNA_ID=CAMNT_0000484421 /DNA_START=353 /DNA_END=2924 /DNA_ORIENTATION=+ /assembly_acc=CAM_ASM_000160